jgi:predicted nucleic acid-binding Zn ribbon protein
MDLHQSVDGAASGQGCVRHWRHRQGWRLCLLKGCEQRFHPASPQARYCSEACQRAACRWRCWRASRRYRASPQGRERRRAQNGRYRQRQRESRRASVLKASPEGPDLACEGQRPAEIPEEFANCPCDRPGCYELFVLQARSPQQRFCSSACRQALRRVRQRERRLRMRRRRGIRRRVYRSRE